MKQKDIILISVVSFFSLVLALVISRMVFAKPANRQQKVEVVQPIVADFPDPDSRYFNANAFDPTQLIQIGTNNNADPFKDVSQ